MELTACFVSASRQNVFFTELLDAFADALGDAGVAVERSVDCFPQLREGLVYVFVPHELLALTLPESHPTAAQLGRSVAVCTEQPGTDWFDQDAEVAERAGAALDVNRLGVHALRKRGVDARLLQLGYVPAWDHWHREDGERPIDVTFQGGATPRRVGALARCGSLIAGRHCELHLFESSLPHQPDSEHFLFGTRKWELLRSSRLMLNIHRSELGYLEWQRAVGCMLNGCVVLSEHSLGFEPLLPGEHFVSVAYESLPAALEGLLDDEQQLKQMRAAAYSLLRDEHPLSRSIEALATAVGDVAARPIVRSELRQTFPLARSKPPQVPPTEYERLATDRGEIDVVRMALKQMLLDQRELQRQLHQLRRQVSEEQLDQYRVERHGRALGAAPRVSVVMTVYNYAGLVGEAIASVAASDFADYELVVVDDASRDGSGPAIRDALARAPWVSARVLTRAHNRGLARARDLGVEAAAGELVFILDADNSIYPNALKRLSGTLDEHGEAVFAYGIIEQFGPHGPSGLMSYLGWDPSRLRYGNYIDAMAMIRRASLLDSGGYTTDPRLHGWEDFALWCELAQRGMRGIRVPEIVARYRVALHSMISLTNIDAGAAWSALIDRFPVLSATG